MFDDLAVRIEPKDIDAGPRSITRPLLKAMQYDGAGDAELRARVREAVSIQAFRPARGGRGPRRTVGLSQNPTKR